MAGWIHTFIYGGNRDNVAQDLEKSYEGNASVYNEAYNEEQNRIDIVSSQGWGHEQMKAVYTAQQAGHVTWWHRHSQPN